MPPQHSPQPQIQKPQQLHHQSHPPATAGHLPHAQETTEIRAVQLTNLTHINPKQPHLIPSPQPTLPPPCSPEPGSVTPVGGPPTYPPPALPPGVAPPARPPGPKTLTTQMSIPAPLKPPPVPSRTSLPFRQASLGPPLGQPPPPPPRTK